MHFPKLWILRRLRAAGATHDVPRRRRRSNVTVLGLVGGAPGGETPRVADSSAAGAGRFFQRRRRMPVCSSTRRQEKAWDKPSVWTRRAQPPYTNGRHRAVARPTQPPYLQ
jgi:hypothetical protein